jgi:hypothetical protein
MSMPGVQKKAKKPKPKGQEPELLRLHLQRARFRRMAFFSCSFLVQAVAVGALLLIVSIEPDAEGVVLVTGSLFFAIQLLFLGAGLLQWKTVRRLREEFAVAEAAARRAGVPLAPVESKRWDVVLGVLSFAGTIAGALIGLLKD